MARLDLGAFNFNAANFGERDYEYNFEGIRKYTETYRGEITNTQGFASMDVAKMTFTAMCGPAVGNKLSLSYVDANNVGTVITHSV